jgi:hypothetical protein
MRGTKMRQNIEDCSLPQVLRHETSRDEGKDQGFRGVQETDSTLRCLTFPPKGRHPLPSHVPEAVALLAAVYTEDAIPSRSSVHGARRQPQGHSVVPAPAPAAIPARLGPRVHSDGARPSAAWTCAARWGKVGPLACPVPPASGRAMLERLERGACRTEMVDRQLNAHPPAYVPRAWADTRALAAIREKRAVGLGVPWYGGRLDGGCAAGVGRVTYPHTPGPDHIRPLAPT